ncbi:helix-turn-helix domain-containing protein [Streptomyces sp. NPDC054796]
MPPRKKQRGKNASAMRMVGQLLANFRRAAGYTQETLALEICAEQETIASIEQGRRVLKRDLAEELDTFLGTKGALAVAVDNLPEMDKYPLWAEEFIDREHEAITISGYENQVVPGLLQTKDYARAVFHNEIPMLDEDEIAQRIAARIERQEILQRKIPPLCTFLITEAVLMDRLGDESVWNEQLHHLRECADIPGITIQVLPFGRRKHAGLSGPFVLLETPDHEHLAYSETQRGSQLISEPDDVSVLAQKYAILRTQVLSPEETQDLLDRLLGES